ncbi:hypothetical protein EV426DRAFT_711367 [Tirmania nivea]|nr:hypothetical protein EV426DRAFT_711367 [Tirmania nivea]
MAGGKAVVFGPVKDWGKSGIKVLLRNGTESRQYTLEGVTNWGTVERFRELDGEGKLREAMEKAKGEADRMAGEDGGFGIVYSREERLSRAGNEVVVVKDASSAERAIELISGGLVIQDVTESGEIPEDSISVTTMVEEDTTVEKIKVRTASGEKSWVIRTPKSVRFVDPEVLVSTFGDGDEEGDSDNEVMRVRSAKKGKKRMVGQSLVQMVKDLGSSASFLGSAPEIPVARSLFPGGKTIPAGRAEDSDVEIEDVVRDDYVTNEAAGGLRESRHAVKGLSPEEASQVVRAILDKADEVHGAEADDKDATGEDEIMGDGTGDDEREATSGSYELPSDSRGMWALVDDIVANLKTIEEIEMIKGGRPFGVRKCLATARSAVNTAGLMLDQGYAVDGTGSNSWEELEDEAVECGEPGKKAVVRKARRGYERVREEGSSVSEGLSREVKRLTEMVTILAALNGVGTPEECGRARKLQARRQAQVAEANRAAAEVKRISEKEKEDRALKKKEEEAKELARKAVEQVERPEEREEEVKAAADPEVVADMAKRFQEAKSQIEKIEKRRATENEVSVGKGLVVIDKKVHRTVTVMVAHKSEIIGVKKASLQAGAVKVASLLREVAQTEGRTAWSASVCVDAAKGKKESRWEIGRVPEEVSDKGVLGRVVPQLVAVFGASDDFEQAWVKRDSTVTLVAADAPMGGEESGKALDILLREENVGVKWGDRYPRVHECWNKSLGVVFEVENSEEAKKVIKKGIVWRGKNRKVAYGSGAEAQKGEQQKDSTPKGYAPPVGPRGNGIGGKAGLTGKGKSVSPPTGPRKGQSMNGRPVGNWRREGFSRPYIGWSNVRCFGCGGAGHMVNSCTSAKGVSARSN